MPANSLQQAKRSFVTVLLTIAALYSVRLMVTRDSSDEDCAKAFKKVSKHVKHVVAAPSLHFGEISHGIMSCMLDAITMVIWL